MREQLYAYEPNALLAYLDRIENATAAEVNLAASMFDDDEPDDDPTGGTYSQDENGAVIRIEGPLSMNGPSPLARFFGFGGTGYREIMASAARARADRPKRVTLKVNSPGGEVAGVDQAWQALQAMAAEIQTVAENGGMMASAAMWLASAAPTIVATSPATEQGSIGIIIVGIDDSKMGEKLGMRRVKIVSRRAPDKGADVDTSRGRDVLQDRADALEQVFLERVAAGRRTTVDDVATNYGKGALLVAREALRVGMIDDIVSAVEPARQPVDGMARPVGAVAQIQNANLPAFVPAAPAAPIQNRRVPMTLIELLQANPGVRADYDAALKAEREAGAAAVQARIAAAKPFLALVPSKAGYDAADVAQIAKLAAEVIAGTEEPGALRAEVRQIDREVEKRKAAAAVAETSAQPPTPAQQHTVSAPAPVIVGAGNDPAKAELELTATVARDRAAAGLK